MKRETTITIVTLLIVSIIMTYFYRTSETEEKVKVGFGKIVELNKRDSITTYSNEAVLIKTFYTYKGSLELTRNVKLANMNYIKEFTMNRKAIDLYELELPYYVKEHDMVITKIEIEHRVLDNIKAEILERKAIMNILTDKIENDEWEMKFPMGAVIMYNKIDSLKIIQLKVTDDISVIFKGNELQLSGKEKTIIDAYINKRLAYDKLNNEEKTKKEFLKKFGRTK